MKIAVTGGAGYIGSFMTKVLVEKGDEVVVIDSLERGNKEVIDPRAKLIPGNILDKNFILNVFSSNKFEAVIHFAGYISMEESVNNPALYFENNTFGALNIISGMQKNGLNNFIFSSTAGVYGNPIKTPIPEDHPKNPTNPYGESKLMVEKILLWFNKVFNINFACLRYFNASGAAIDGSMGEDHKPETHIIPNAINALLNNEVFYLYGQDYKTPDGTCVRDYIHVLDLVESHVLVLKKLTNDGGGHYYNVGTGNGYSNKEIIETLKKIANKDFKVEIKERRPGDAETLIADSTKIKTELGFLPKYSDLETIIKSAWEWHKKLKIQSKK